MNQVSESAHDYRLYGWRLRSQRPLPFLLQAEPDAARPCDVEIRFAPVTPRKEPVVRASPFTAIHADGAIVLTRPEGLRVLIEEGRRLTVDLTAGVTEAELHTWLFGPAMLMLCHQRGQPPLHASVVEIGGRGVAFAGDGGAGKSTTARALMERGHRLVTDDHAIIDPESRLVHPGYPTMKLWDRVAAAFGDAVDGRLRVKRGIAKFHRPVGEGFRPDPVPLALVLVLETVPGSDAPVAGAPQPPAAAAALLHRHLPGLGVARVLDGGRAAFRWTTVLARRVPVRILRRSDSLAVMDVLCDTVGDLVRSFGEGDGR